MTLPILPNPAARRLFLGRHALLEPPSGAANGEDLAALIRRIVLVSFLLLAGAFGLFLRELAQGHSLAEARTVAVNVFVMVEAAYLFNCRSLTQGFWKQGLFSNLWIWAGVGSMMLLQLAMTYLPVMNQLFGTAPIGLAEWLEITLVALFSSSVIALEKWLSNARRKL